MVDMTIRNNMYYMFGLIIFLIEIISVRKMLKKDEIIDPCLKYIPRHDKYSFNKALEEEDSPLIAKLRNKLSSYLPNNSPTPNPVKAP
jgi:hypothetical protein